TALQAMQRKCPLRARRSRTPGRDAEEFLARSAPIRTRRPLRRTVLAGAVTLFVLFAAAAGARIVPPHLRRGSRRSPRCRSRLLRSPRAARAAPDDLPRARLHLPLEPRRLLRLRPALHPHQLADQLVVDGRQHLHEAVIPFLLVGL